MTPDERPHGLTRYNHGPDERGTPGKGCRCPECREANSAWARNQYRMIAYGRWQPFRDAAGTRRRLQALIWNGWSFTGLAARLGCTRQAVRARLDYGKVTVAVEGAIRALYDDLWDQAPPEGTKDEKRAVTMARRYAREHGFVPVGAWDDDPGPHCIDDPAAVPAPSWQPPLFGAAIRAARIQAGLSQYKLAAAVGLSRSCIQQFENGVLTPGEQHWEQLELTLGPLGVVRDARAAAGDGGQRGDEQDAA